MKNQAFTLIELLVVVLIIGILAAIALPQYQYAVMKSRATKQVIILKSLRDAFDMYYLQKGEDVIPDLNNLDIKMPEKFDVSILNNSDGIYASVHNMYDTKTNTNDLTKQDGFVIRYFIKCKRFPEYTGKIVCNGQNAGSFGDRICQDIGGTGKHSYKFISSQNAWYLN